MDFNQESRIQNQESFLSLATKRLKREIDADDHNRRAAVEDLKFLAGDQWDAAEERRRALRGRPCLTVNELPKYVNQVVGDMRQNRTRVKVRPVDSGGDVAIAKVRSGLIANIEYLSGAESIYDYAGEMAASCGYGAWRIGTRYTEEDPFLQEIYIERIKNPFLVYMDSSAKAEDYSDAKYGFVLEKVTKEEFEERFPGRAAPAGGLSAGTGAGREVWFAQDTFFIADYYVVEHEKRTVCLMADGSVMEAAEAERLKNEWLAAGQPGPGAQSADRAPSGLAGAQGAVPLGPSAPPLTMPPDEALPPSLIVKKERTIEEGRVRWYAICADAVLAGPKDVPGRYVPVVLVRGPERVIEGRSHVRSLIRDAKDAQRLLNFWVTDSAEIVDMIPKAPWIGTARQFEGYEQDYAAANAENFPFLKYNIDGGAPPPQRVSIGDVPSAVFAQIAQAKQAIRDAIGMYASDLGDAGPELSGRAILQRQKPGDVATFAFIDNLARAIAHSGRIINEMVPEVYDTARDVRIRNADETEAFVPVNTTAGAAIAALQAEPGRYQGIDGEALGRLAAAKGAGARYNDLSSGRYDVVVTTGPSFATQRQEAACALERLVAAYPAVMAVAGDLVYKFQDFTGAEEIAERIARTLPPDLAPTVEGRPARAPAVSPQVQLQAAELEIKRARLELERQKLELEKLRTLKELKGGG